MAIQRPARGGGQQNQKGDGKKPVTGTSKSKIEKRSFEEFAKALTGNGPKLLPARIPLRVPENMSTENDWLKYLNTVSIMQVSDYLEGASPDDIDVTQALVLKNAASRILRALEKQPDGFNEWLDYFSGMTRAETENFIDTHSLTMDNEAMAAGKRWLQIAENPALIDKIVNSRLESRKAEQIGDIMQAAKSGDDLALYEAIRDNLAYKIQDGSGARDMSVLIKQLNEVTTHLNTIYRERGMRDNQQDNIRKLLINSRQRQRRPKQQAIKKISDIEDDDFELESL